MIHFDILGIEKTIEELTQETNLPGFWDNPECSTEILTKMKRLQNKLEKFKALENELKSLAELNDLLLLEPDENLSKQVIHDTEIIEKNIDALELETLFFGKYDKNNAIITLHPGARRNRIARLGRNAI